MRSRSELLWVYAATPLLVGTALLDAGCLRGALRDALPDSPAALPLYAVLFGMPHIVGSFFAYVDPAIRAPAQPLLVRAALASALAIVAVGWLFSDTAAQALLIVVTMIHVMGQQTGLALGAARLPHALRGQAALWKVTTAAIACVAALSVGGEFMTRSLLPTSALWFKACGAALVASSVLAWWLARAGVRNGGETRLLFATHYTLVCGWLLIAFDYPLFGIALLRIVHDATAFSFYIRLAAVRERNAPGANTLYRGLGLRGRTVAWAVLPLAVLLAGAGAVLLPGGLMLGLVLMHYVVERRVWRGGGTLGRHLRSARPQAPPSS